MSASGLHASDERLLAFEIESSVFALPIEAVLEVAEVDRVTCVPGIDRDTAGVMNWHGDPLPLVASRLLLSAVAEGPGGAASHAAAEPSAVPPLLREQVLVLSDRVDETARLGMPVDRVVGLVQGAASAGRSHDVVQERRPVDGRVVSVLDPQRLVARAEEIIERAVEETDA